MLLRYVDSRNVLASITDIIQIALLAALRKGQEEIEREIAEEEELARQAQVSQTLLENLVLITDNPCRLSGRRVKQPWWHSLGRPLLIRRSRASSVENSAQAGWSGYLRIDSHIIWG